MTPRVAHRLTFAAGVSTELETALGYDDVRTAIDDDRGEVVRTTPHRTTWRSEIGGQLVFRKVRTTRARDARNEWHWLHELPKLGVGTPVPLFFAEAGSNTAVGMLAAPRRPLIEVIAESEATPVDYIVEQVAPLVARLHELRLCHRDLYWNHLFAESRDTPRGRPTLIDVERVFRPMRWRVRRYRIKDLAGLVSSWPGPRSTVLGLRFLARYQGGRLQPGWKRLARAIQAKAARIAAHVPRHG